MADGFLGTLLDRATTQGLFGTEGSMQRLISEGFAKIEGSILAGFEGVKLDAGDFAPFGSIKYWNKVYKSIKSINQELGIAGSLSMNMEKSFRGSLRAAVAIGASFDDLAGQYGEYIEAVGRNQQLSSEELYRLVEVKQAFGEGAIEIFETFDRIGISITDTSNFIQNMGIRANKIGINYAKVTNELKKNIGAIDKFSFRNGVRGLERMAELSVQTKLDMQSALGFADKLWEGSIEGAIETSANLQVLGGEFAAMADPFELFYMARNEPEELMKTIQETATSVASFNRELGEVVIDPLGMSQLREMASATGMDFQELARTAKMSRKEMEIGGLFDYSIQSLQDFDSTLTKVAGAATFDKQLGTWTVTIDNMKKAVSDLTQADIAKLDFIATDDEQQVFMELIRTNESLDETLQRLIDEVKLGMLSSTEYETFFPALREMTDNIRETLTSGGFADFISFFQQLSSDSFSNFMDIFNRVGDGDFQGAGGLIMDNLKQGFEDLMGVIGNGLYSIAKVLLGTLKWMGMQLIKAIGNGFIWLGNQLYVAFLSTFDPSGALGMLQGGEDLFGYMEFDNFSDFMPSFGEELINMLPPDIIDKIGTDFGELGNDVQMPSMPSPNLNLMQDNPSGMPLPLPSGNLMNTPIFMGTGGTNDGSTSSIDGEIIMKHIFPSGNEYIESLSNVEKTELENMIMKTLKGDRMAGGNTTGMG